jgi:hypothetical protein
MKSNGKLGFAALAWLLMGCASLLVACGDDDDDDGGGGGSTTFACGQEGQFCVLYTGSASSIDAIRDATSCEEQYYYGLEGDDIEANEMICESLGGTFTAP